MSSIRDIREISNDRLTKFTNRLAKKFSQFQTAQQTEKLENKEDIYSAGQDVDSVVRFHNFTSTKKFIPTTQYFPPDEPDNDKLRIWLRARNMGETCKDLSGKDNNAVIFGEPILVNGYPFDDGISTGGTKSLALQFNRPTSPTENEEGIYIPADTSFRASEGLSTGISFFIRFRLFSLSQQGNADIRLFEKIDNDAIDDGILVHVSPSGSIKLQFDNSNVQYLKETASGTITTNTIYDVWFTYTKSGNVFHIYVNNVDKTLSAGSAVGYHSDQTDHDLNIFHRGADSSGHVYGDLYDFREYRERIVSTAEVGYHFTNKWTVSNIPFGQVMITDYYSTYDVAAGFGYTSTGFTTAGYTAG